MTVSCVLIDDDPMVREVWEWTAAQRGLKVALFSGPEPVLSNRDGFPKEVPIFVDLGLSDGICGLEVSRKLHDEGFKSIYVCSGHLIDPSGFPWVSGVVGKDMPDWVGQ